MLAAAMDLASISGLVFDDFTGNGFDPGEQVANVSLDLFRDDGDGVFEPTSGDSAVRMTITDADGKYSFQRLTAGNYWVQQPAQNASGRTLQEHVSLVLISSTAAQGQLVTEIDTFDGASQSVSDSSSNGIPDTSSELRSEAIGGERDLLVNLTSAAGEIRLGVNNLAPNVLSFDALSNGNGVRRITWDGIDGDATTVNDSATGLNLNVASGSTAAGGLNLRIGSDPNGGTAVIRIYSDDTNAGTANRFSTATVPIPITGGTAGTPHFVDFSTDFSATSGGGVNLASISAIELEITGAANINGVAELVGTLGSTSFTQDFDNFESSDLALTKSVSDETPTTNQNVTFAITVSNAGPDDATGIEVTDLLPGGITYVSHSTSQGNYDNASGVWTVGALNRQSSATLSIVGRVNTTGQVINTASITASDQTDGNTGNNQATVTLTPESIDIGISKQVSNSSPNLGENVTFTINAFNAGPSTATGVLIRDVLPAGLAFFSANESQGNYSNGSGTWDVGALGSGASASLALVATVNTNGSLTNTASLSASDQADINSNNNQASVTLSTAMADLSLNKTVDVSTPNVGDDVTFTITVSNQGPNPATGVTVTDVLPTGMSFVSQSPSQGNYDAGSGVWTVGDVAVGATPSLNLTARVNSVGSKTNIAQVSGSDQTDPNSSPGNNLGSEDDQDSVTITPASADLSLDKQVNNNNPDVGETVDFMLSLFNAGPNTATNIVVSDRVPTGTTFVSASPSTGLYNSNNGEWTIGSLSSGSTATLTIRARVDTTSSITNTARVEAVDQFDKDSTPGNDAPGEDDQDSVTLVPSSADLSLTKIVSDSDPSVGDQVTFTITVTNSGPNDATGITVLDQLPLGTSFDSATPTQGDYNQTSGIWNVGSIPNGGTATLSLVAIANSTGLAVNSAQIMTSNQQDPDSTPGNNEPAEDDQSDAEISPQQIDLSLTKTVSDPSPNVGTNVTFVITVRNDGPNTATGVMATESLPSGVTLLSSSPSQGSFNLSNGVWTIGSLSRNNQVTISLVARVDDPGTGTNTAQITAADQSDVDSTPANNVESEDDQASISFTTPIADLSLSKSVSDATPNVGDTVSFNVVLTNNGPDDATGVSVSDVVPAGMTYLSNNLSAGSYDAGTGIWDIGGLADGATAELEIRVQVDTEGAKTNTARVLTSDQNDPDSTPGNNIESEDDQDSISLNPQVADLSVTKTASASRPAIGEQIQFTVTANNAGPDDATGIIITDALPSGLSFVAANPSAGSYDAGSGVWNLGSIAANSSATLELTAQVDTLGDKINVAEVTSVDQFDKDSTPGNNDPTEDDQASVTITPASADLSLTKTVDDPSPNVGQVITYTLTVNSEGPDTTEDVMVRDTLPSGMTFQSATPSVGSYDSASRIWTIPSLAPNRSATLEIRAMVDSPGDKSNSAEIIASSQLDPDSTPDNNIPSEDDQDSAVLSPELVDLALTKSLDNLAPNIGDTITYTLALSNDGPTRATGVEVTDRLPATVSIERVTPTVGTYSPSTGVWMVGEVAVGATPTLTISAIVGDTGGEANTAEVTAVDQPDSDSTPNNNVPGEDDQATAAFVTQVADLSLNKTVDNASPNMTDTVNFRLTVFNAGPDTATDVVVTDLLPAGLRYVSDSPSVGSYDPTSGQWSIAALPSGSGAILQLEAAVTSATPAINIAEVTSMRQIDPDSVPGNALPDEDDYAEIGITPQLADISVSGTVNDPEPLTGDTIQLVFTVINSGPSDASNLALNSLLPEGLALLSSQPQTGSYNSVSGEWEVGNLAAGASTQLILNARVDTRGVKRVPIEVIRVNEFDQDSTPNNGSEIEDDQTEVVIKAPRRLYTGLFLSR